MFVLTIDQRGSRRGLDRVPELLRSLRGIPAELGFERSVGDELQGALADPGAVVEAALLALRSGHWYVGIGVGAVDLPLPGTAREARGPAFVAARQAVERAKKAGERVPLAVTAGSRAADGAASAAEAVLCLIGRLVMDRSTAEWRVLDLLQPGVRGQQAAVAGVLGISPQAVSKAVLRSGWQEEHAGRAASELLLEFAAGGSLP
jgi:hypothetical protein